jgi:hypothetical protein
VNTNVALTIVNENLVLSNSERSTERLIQLSALLDNKRYSAIPDSIKLTGVSPTLLHICGNGRNVLRLTFDGIQQFENACPREDGSLEVAFLKLGKILIVPVSGALWHNAMWIPEKAQCNDFIVDLLPSAETRQFEAKIYAYYSNGLRTAN